MKHQYHSDCQQRILQVLMCLFGHEIAGLSPGQVAKAAQISPAQATRDLWNLEHAGLIERLPEGDRVRVSPQLGRKAVVLLQTLDTAQRQLDDLKHRYTHLPVRPDTHHPYNH